MTLQKADRNEPPGLRGFLLELGDGENGFGGTEFGKGRGTLEETLGRFDDMAAGRNLRAGQVRQTVFWLLDDQGAVIGMSRLRHELTEGLLHHGGHIGYYVSPTARGKGHGRALLAATLDEAKKLCLRMVLITTDADNAASIGNIRANGGILDDIRRDEKGKEFHRYWIDLDTR